MDGQADRQVVLQVYTESARMPSGRTEERGRRENYDQLNPLESERLFLSIVAVAVVSGLLIRNEECFCTLSLSIREQSGRIEFPGNIKERGIKILLTSSALGIKLPRALLGNLVFHDQRTLGCRKNTEPFEV